MHGVPQGRADGKEHDKLCFLLFAGLAKGLDILGVLSSVKKVVLLDRDGVINREQTSYYTQSGNELKGYVLSPEQLEFLPRALDALRLLNENDYKIHVLSNQSAVGRGLLSWETLEEITRKMVSEIRSYGGDIESVQYCTHRPEDECRCRKPRSGMFIDLARVYHIDYEHAWFVGDSLTDIEPAKMVGCRTILVNSDLKKHSPFEHIEHQLKPDFFAEDLWEAVTEIILENPNGE